MSDSKPRQRRIRRPAFVSRMTVAQKRELVRIAIDMGMKGDFSGIAAMAEVEKLDRMNKSDSDQDS